MSKLPCSLNTVTQTMLETHVLMTTLSTEYFERFSYFDECRQLHTTHMVSSVCFFDMIANLFEMYEQM